MQKCRKRRNFTVTELEENIRAKDSWLKKRLEAQSWRNQPPRTHTAKQCQIHKKSDAQPKKKEGHAYPKKSRAQEEDWL